MYVNKCSKCGSDFETKNPKRVICPSCLYPDRKPILNTNEPTETKEQDQGYNKPQGSFSDRRPYQENRGGYNQGERRPYNNQQGGYNRPQGNYGDRSQGGYNRPQGNYGDRSQGGYNRPQGNYGDRSQGGYNRPQGNYGDRSQGGYNRPQSGYNRPQGNYGDRPQGGYNRPQGNYGDRAQGGYNRPQGNYGDRAQGGYNRPQGNYGRPQSGGFRRPQQGGFNRNRPQKKLLVSREQVAQIEVLYKRMLPLPNPDAHEVIGKEIDLESNKVFFGINLVRQKMKLPKLPFPKRKLAVSPDQLTAIQNLYEPLLPLPPIGCHKIIASQLKMDEWRVHVGVGLVRKQLDLPRWNPDREDAPEEFKNQPQPQEQE